MHHTRTIAADATANTCDAYVNGAAFTPGKPAIVPSLTTTPVLQLLLLLLYGARTVRFPQQGEANRGPHQLSRGTKHRHSFEPNSKKHNTKYRPRYTGSTPST
ncbi:hypothetical protein BHE74_00022962 [Ensete ventricosum]|nr:hypothetical protein BHE74_00022962 [Ensete ventricosum]